MNTSLNMPLKQLEEIRRFMDVSPKKSRAAAQSHANLQAKDHGRSTPKPCDRTTFTIDSVITGKITAVKEYGVFVKFNNGEGGLIHYKEIPIGVKDTLKPEDQIQVHVIGFIPGKGLSLSLRAIYGDKFFKQFIEEHPVDTVVTGTIGGIKDFGVFVRLGLGVSGLIHTSKANAAAMTKMRKIPYGSEIKVRIIDVDHKRMRISLAPAE